jgi:hypothetical protein
MRKNFCATFCGNWHEGSDADIQPIAILNVRCCNVSRAALQTPEQLKFVNVGCENLIQNFYGNSEEQK